MRFTPRSPRLLFVLLATLANHPLAGRVARTAEPRAASDAAVDPAQLQGLVEERDGYFFPAGRSDLIVADA